jgi:hypothetical protein
MTSEGQAEARVSLATQPTESRREFHKLRHGDADVHREISVTVDGVIRNVSKALDQKGQVFAVLRLAARGDLPTGNDIKDEIEPCRTQPMLWELKWKRPRSKAEFRLYHAEPAGGGPDFVALRFHVKSLAGSQSQIDAAQDQEMQVAADRYECAAAVEDRWGHQPDGCTGCIAES